ncbi:MAG: hypothetical protein M1819_000702 [Sarea resinae]|nr:MAG: hypothetical protein M1819_000702 [Sarea resinae]
MNVRCTKIPNRLHEAFNDLCFCAALLVDGEQIAHLKEWLEGLQAAFNRSLKKYLQQDGAAMPDRRIADPVDRVLCGPKIGNSGKIYKTFLTSSNGEDGDDDGLFPSDDGG